MQVNFETEKKVVFAAMSKRNFYLREHIIKFILQNNCSPTCAFMMYSYFLLDTVERKRLIRANNDLIRRSDELWVFGDISDGVQKEIKLAKKLGRTIRFFEVKKHTVDFIEIAEDKAKVEPLN